jgi:3-deoxy-D-manno-octulosonic-acid transferase
MNASRRSAPDAPWRPPSEDAADWRLRQQFLGLIALAALPLAALIAAHRVLVRRKPLTGAGEKLSGRGPRATPGQVLVHGVSLGEVMLMRPLVPRLEAAFGARCLLTTTTDTGRRALDEQFPRHQRAFLPFDAPWAVGRFLARTRPCALVLLELEIWPALLCACRERGIPVLLLNARINEGSFRGYRTLRPLTRPLLRGLALALAQNPLWGARLAALGVPRARLAVPGSLKADMVRPAGAA